MRKPSPPPDHLVLHYRDVGGRAAKDGDPEFQEQTCQLPQFRRFPGLVCAGLSTPPSPVMILSPMRPGSGPTMRGYPRQPTP